MLTQEVRLGQTMQLSGGGSGNLYTGEGGNGSNGGMRMHVGGVGDSPHAGGGGDSQMLMGGGCVWTGGGGDGIWGGDGDRSA